MLIKLNKMLIPIVLGVHTWEQAGPRPIECSIDLSIDDRCGSNDLLESTVDYDLLRRDILTFLENKNYRLIEKLALDIEKLCLEREFVEGVRVEVIKPSPIPETESVSVIRNSLEKKNS